MTEHDIVKVVAYGCGQRAPAAPDERWKGGRLEGWRGGRLEGRKAGKSARSYPTFQSSNLPIFQPSNLPPFHPSTLPQPPPLSNPLIYRITGDDFVQHGLGVAPLAQHPPQALHIFAGAGAAP
jgi:hypothetical protein